MADLSMPGGGASYHHASNNAGRVMDIAMFNKNYGPAGGHYEKSKTYDREATANFIREMVAASIAKGKKIEIWFNDAELQKKVNAEFRDKYKIDYDVVTNFQDHDDHLHVMIGE